MREQEAEQVVAGLRELGLIAAVFRLGMYRCAVRVPLGDGREALWDADGAAGLEAQIMRDGVLVGYVPQIPGSEGWDVAQTVRAISTARYDEER